MNYAPRPVRSYASQRTLSKLVAGLLGIIAMTSVLSMVSSLLQDNMLAVMGTRAQSNDPSLLLTLAGLGLAALAIVMLGFITLVLFMIWIFRAYRNLPILGAKELRASPGWAVLAWFIPILNLWKPFLILKEIYAKSQNDNPELVEDPGYIVTFWWGLTILQGFTAFVLNWLQLSDPLVYAGWPIIVTAATSGITIILLLWIVLAIGHYQEEKARLLGVSHVQLTESSSETCA